ncbi:phenylacetic acid degradation bifunctional protein PaaZ [Roseibium denhamense]|uniref:Oxepin-CoA hydrolase / 3-oxo-5,6-dehydrosuberyl-CoA semialdehyde dehydrogenase n=1 Tax=Roseibium denhamense TaxID=76305 RepID=A0ABY1PFZ2_9HYPH|nr:phenylacetic acid degradation bifunctional protein PaaZ [Roseibium denhamense]MTI06133.1 phenylacetic acid degradation bifunctional protein PaaZ [Roseibium denhamense]SMP32168.1 oxepin-CoA hydrolase / 3-oxo-5,6-dehydrosuberyl-CoA semialdehyde dehydrogenase [Roseibium denhamense]
MTVVSQNARVLESYLAGRWQPGKAEGKLLADPSNGDPVAVIDASGIDLGEALAYGRATGGAALRKMTYHERALMLKSLAQHLMEKKEVFYPESFKTGATRKDSWIDIEGGIGTLFAYSSKARREMPNTRVFVEGPVEPLSRDKTFSAQHVLTALTGIAVHINAFNFPVWGMLEKIAPALIAGMPCLVKPASQTAYLTELVVRHIQASGLVPEGALQLLCGSAGDLMDHLTGQDAVTFTGSAATGQMLRRHPVIVENSIRFTMEADSLNAAVLGPDATPDTPEFDLFVKEVGREITVKAGQKCTAVRRIIVPRGLVGPVQEALALRLKKTVVGDPRDEAVTMGALASGAQKAEVLERIAELTSGAEIVAGGGEADGLDGQASAGAFLQPTLLYCDKPAASEAVHSVEAFGPVATLMPYDDIGAAIDLTHRGKGSLVASVFTNDPNVAEEAVLGMAPFHGRIMIGNRASAKTSTGHGSPLPMLVHGGPGRAGGGEELGGLRSVKHYMQRTAVQGTPHLLGAVTDRWVDGAPGLEDTKHPFRKSLADLKIGDRWKTGSRTVTLEDIEHFATFTGDTFYAHMDADAASRNPFFGGRVAHGYLIVSFAAGLFVDPDEGPVLANYGVDNLRFLTPVNAGDTLQVALTAKEISPRITADYGEVCWDCLVSNQNGDPVAQYDVLTLVAKEWPAGSSAAV